jgi:ribosomal protein S18 acetylase RimI-like enzyme
MEILRVNHHDAPQYAESLVTIYRSLWLESIPSDELDITTSDVELYFNDFDDRVYAWKNRILVHPNRALWILENDTHETEGFAVATRKPGSYELDFLFILSAYQGRGYGRALAERCLEWLGNDEPTHLGVARHNSHAINLYEKLGFVQCTEPRPNKLIGNSKQIPWIEMIRY